MKNQFLHILRSLDEKEIKDLILFAESPYFNTSERLIKLLKELVKYHPNYNFITSESIHKKVFPHLEYNDSTMRRLYTDCDKLLKEFLKYVNFEKNEFRINEIYRDEIGSRALTELYEKNTEEVEDMFNKDGLLEDLYFLYRSNFEADKFIYSYINKKLIRTGNITSETENLKNSSNLLFIYFLIKNIKLYVNVKTYQSMYSTNDPENIKNTIDSILNSFDKTKIKELFTLRDKDYSFIYTIYVNLFKMYSDSDNPKHFVEMKNDLNKNLDKFIIFEKRYLVQSMIDYCIQARIDNIKGVDFTNELIKLYELQLNKKLYIDSESTYLSLNLFRNILIFALNADKLKWAKKFVNIYANRLNPELKEDVVNYSLARINFTEGNYSQALSYFNEIRNNNLNLRIDERNMSLIIHYELGNFQLLESTIPSHRKYFKQNKVLSKDRKKTYLNFNTYFSRIVRLYGYRNHIYINRFIKEVKGENNLLFRDWFLKKANELLQQRRLTA
ncbi:MAG: hypothetical protein IAE65_11405 [Ignavibacteria bacterium]|nr:hypothetical protein [Ignavibacteria bacterium]